MTDHSNPLLAHVRFALEHDRAAVQRLNIDLCTDLLPALARDDSPGWQGLARRSFDLRCEKAAAEVRRVSSTLDEIVGVLATAIEGLSATT